MVSIMVALPILVPVRRFMQCGAVLMAGKLGERAAKRPDRGPRRRGDDDICAVLGHGNSPRNGMTGTRIQGSYWTYLCCCREPRRKPQVRQATCRRRGRLPISG